MQIQPLQKLEIKAELQEKKSFKENLGNQGK